MTAVGTIDTLDTKFDIYMSSVFRCFILQILELTFSSMQMLLVWNLTEIDANEPDKVLISMKGVCECI